MCKHHPLWSERTEVSCEKHSVNSVRRWRHCLKIVILWDCPTWFRISIWIMMKRISQGVCAQSLFNPRFPRLTLSFESCQVTWHSILYYTKAFWEETCQDEKKIIKKSPRICMQVGGKHQEANFEHSDPRPVLIWCQMALWIWCQKAWLV